MMIIFEFSRPVQLRPWSFNARLDGRRFFRVGWLLFAVSVIGMPHYDYHERVSSGETVWIM